MGLRAMVAVVVLAMVVAACGANAGRSSSAADVHRSANAKPAQQDGAWPTYHRDQARTGFDPSGPALGQPHEVWRAKVDGKVYAEPLVAAGLVIVATENDSVYALDPGDGHVVWKAELGTPVDGSTLPCGNIDPSGITSTPVIDTAQGTVYAVAFVRPAEHVLVALDLASGNERWRRSVDPPNADPKVHQQRAALALSRGRVYVAYGGLYGDCGDYNGWVIGARTAEQSGPLEGYRVPTEREGGIWGPSGPAIDGRGNVFVATGNGSSFSSFDFGNAIIRLSPALHRRSFFAPPDAADLNASDTDLGSVGPSLLTRGRVFAIGKSGVGYLLRGKRLGGVGGDLFGKPVCDGAYGGLAYAGERIYVPCTNGIVALRLKRRSFRTAWHGPAFNAGPPIVADGTVWTVDVDSGTLYALSRQSGRARFQADLGEVAHFDTPAASGGRIYVGTGDGVAAFASN